MLFVKSTHADLPAQFDEASANDPNWSGAFVLPNETHPQDARELYRSAPPGILVSTGLTRVLFALTMMKDENRRGAIVVDRDASIVAHWRLLGDLFIAAPTARDFRELVQRLTVRAQAGRSRESLKDESSAQIFASGHYDALTQQVLIRSLARLQKALFAPTFFPRQSFAGVNPFVDEVLYKKIRDEFANGRIDVFYGDFGEIQTQQRIVDRLHSRDERIAIVDLSNAVEPQYLDIDHQKTMLDTLGREMFDTSLWLFTRLRDSSQLPPLIKVMHAISDHLKLASPWDYFSINEAEVRAAGLDYLAPPLTTPSELARRQNTCSDLF